MPEINVTAFVTRNADQMELFSDSIANSGLDNIGQLTFRNAVLEVTEHGNLCEDVSELIEHFASYGAWDREELSAMSLRDLNALLVQFIAGGYREMEAGGEPGALYQGDAGGWFYYLGM